MEPMLCSDPKLSVDRDGTLCRAKVPPMLFKVLLVKEKSLAWSWTMRSPVIFLMPVRSIVSPQVALMVRTPWTVSHLATAAASVAEFTVNVGPLHCAEMKLSVSFWCSARPMGGELLRETHPALTPQPRGQ